MTPIFSIQFRSQSFETLEPRRLLAAASPLPDILYVQSNNPAAGQNAILAFHRNPQTGTLVEFDHPFLTGGTGTLNAAEVLGPDDSDQEIVTVPSQRLLYTVNQGSNDISAFRYDDTGALTLIGRFGSGGVQPVSIALAGGDQVVVVNRGNTTPNNPNGTPGNYVTFRIKHDGSLKQVPNSAVTLSPAISPAQALVSPDGSFVFGDSFVPPPNFSIAKQVESFTIAANNRLQRVPGSPFGANVTPPTILGLQNHPSQRIVYAGLVAANKLGVFTYNDAGQLNFVRAVNSGGQAICWISVDKNADFAYVVETATNDISVFSLADPLNPALIQTIRLGGPQRPDGADAPPQTNPFQVSLDPEGKHLYVINHETTLANNFPQGNALHTLNVAANGTLSEPALPFVFNTAEVPAFAHPRGVLVLGAAGVGDEADAPPDGFAAPLVTRTVSTSAFRSAESKTDGDKAALNELLE